MMANKLIKQTSSEKLSLIKRGYRILGKIGEGAFSSVYYCEYEIDKKTHPKNVACKLIDLNSGAAKQYVLKFLPRELEVLKQISHPNIIHIQSIFQRDKKYYIFMRYAERGDLLDFILKYGPICESQTKIWSKQIASAIEYLHTLKIVHRDLKCENILITFKYNTKLTDFGFARFYNQTSLSETYCGSFLYVAPEVLRGNPYDAKISDYWSFGIIVFTMLNKALPFNDQHVKSLYTNQMNKNWKFSKKTIDKLSDSIKEIIQSLLEPNLNERMTVTQFLNSIWISTDQIERIKSKTMDSSKNVLPTRDPVAVTAIKQNSPMTSPAPSNDLKTDDKIINDDNRIKGQSKKTVVIVENVKEPESSLMLLKNTSTSKKVHFTS